MRLHRLFIFQKLQFRNDRVRKQQCRPCACVKIKAFFSCKFVQANKTNPPPRRRFIANSNIMEQGL